MPVPPETGVVIHGQDLPVAEMIERARLAEKIGVDAVWLVQLPSLRDSAAVLAALACVTERVALGAGVLPFYTRPPVTMAQTALTVDELSGGRFTLGVGSGHRVTGEWMLGVPTGPPVGSMREYLSVVTSLIRDGEVHETGAWYRAHAVYAAPRRAGLPVYLGAFGPRLAELAGEAADGLMLWMCTAAYIHEVVMPALERGLRRSGRSPDGFPVVAMVPGAVSEDLAGDRELLRRYLAAYARVPTYRRMYELSGFGDELARGAVSDGMLDGIAVLGDEAAVRDMAARYARAGATQVVVTPMASAHNDRALFTRTVEALVGR
ncbi:LLM class F420-dependent oxidoreductase [Planobispora rosea]|uniref:LLM class F420-dependent oxidoreductase n=1 Tax=Planobispora rosea TaxID=35762 RepID=A0A8J3S8G5_PLARO|nr:LLM class flavin-dependent oxidoreductase [Planobispora rosea]GGT03512.1 LLM class F420-dependent oxidoreductase [Planobispora rosea]GIH88739.1 LLM class F420-dependent oxidoreductase [Planobispora rosea]